jgi:hypothetical protein
LSNGKKSNGKKSNGKSSNCANAATHRTASRWTNLTLNGNSSTFYNIERQEHQTSNIEHRT